MWLLLPLSAVLLIAYGFLRKTASVKGALGVEHFPNPTQCQYAPVSKERPFPYVWYYRTEVRNRTDKPLQVVRFESFFWERNRWVASNVLRRPLTTEVFLRWYGVEDGSQDGWLQPGAKAVCDINWHGFSVSHAPKAKWVFYAVDEQGRRHEGEGEVISLPYEAEAADTALGNAGG
jgi:hypothetical protein